MKRILQLLPLLATLGFSSAAQGPPNIIFIFSDDHAQAAISAYGSKVNKTPNIDRIAEGGARFTNSFVTNSICTPSRATLLTGQYSHLNGVPVFNRFDGARDHVAKHLQAGGYHTGMIGKWHLGSDPTGFDRWIVLPGQGNYWDPQFLVNGKKMSIKGHCTDITTDLGIEFLETRPKDKPFFLMLHQKAPHRKWQPAERHIEMFKDTDAKPPPVRCPPDESGLFCVDVLFVWAPGWKDMIKRLPIVTKYTPTFVVGCTGNTYEKTHAKVSQEMTDAWGAFAADPPTRLKLRSIVFTHWPYGQSNSKTKIESFAKWIEEDLRGQRFLLSDIYSLQQVYKGSAASIPRLHSTWHTMCGGVGYNGQGKAKCGGVAAQAIMDAWGNCSVATEYINVRAMLTLAEHTPEVTTPGNCVENCL